MTSVTDDYSPSSVSAGMNECLNLGSWEGRASVRVWVLSAPRCRAVRPIPGHSGWRSGLPISAVPEGASRKRGIGNGFWEKGGAQDGCQRDRPSDSPAIGWLVRKLMARSARESAAARDGGRGCLAGTLRGCAADHGSISHQSLRFRADCRLNHWVGQIDGAGIGVVGDRAAIGHQRGLRRRRSVGQLVARGQGAGA
jgi:hypothetical protein